VVDLASLPSKMLLSNFRFWRQQIFSSPKPAMSSLGPTQPLGQCLLVLFPGVKAAGVSEIDSSPPLSARIKN